MRNRKAALLAISVMSAALFAAPVTENALLAPFATTQEAKADVSGDYEYTVKNGEATITKYFGAGGDITIPAKLGGYKVTAIANNAFKGNTNLQELVIPSNITTIGYGAFQDSSITKLQIGATVTSWGDYYGNYAFRNCDKLLSVDINSPVIPREAFKDCNNLKTVIIGHSTKTVGKSAFESCGNLIGISMGDNVETIGDSAFKGTTLYKGTMVLTNVVSIGNYAFQNSGIAGVNFGTKLTTLGYGAFENAGLKSVKIPASVTEWKNYYGCYTFRNCDNLTTVTISSEKVGEQAFKDCDLLQKVVIGTKTTNIEKEAFKDCHNLQTLTMGANVKTIGNSAFENTEKFTGELAMDKVEKVGNKSFNNSGISAFKFPKSLKSIGYGAFEKSGLKSVNILSTLTEWITYYGCYTFRNCDALTSVSINSVIVPEQAFQDCDALKTVKIGSNTQWVEKNAFEGCDSLDDVIIGYGVTKIAKEAFANCPLKDIVLPEDLQFLGYRAFANTAAKTVAIPDGVAFEMNYNRANTFEKNGMTDVYVGYDKMSLWDGYFENAATPKFHIIAGTDAESYAKSKGYTIAKIKEIPATAVKFNKSTYTLVYGESLQLFPNLTPQNSTDSLTWSVSDEGTLSVDQNGLVTALVPGQAKVYVKTKSGIKKGCTINVVYDGTSSKDTRVKRDISLATVSGISDKTYNGKPFTPVVTMKFNEYKPMKEGRDFTVAYENNTAVGTAKVTITGIGRYTGTVTKTFAIKVKAPFTDVPSTAYYKGAVEYVYSNGIMKGTSADKFSPSAQLTRGMMVTILWNMAGMPKASGSLPFKDVSSNNYFYNALVWAYNNKVVSGTSATTFSPGENITREQLAVMFMNYYTKYANGTAKNLSNLSTFKDVKGVASYALNAVKWAVGNGVISGKSGGAYIDPKGLATRAEVACMVMNYCKNLR